MTEQTPEQMKLNQAQTMTPEQAFVWWIISSHHGKEHAISIRHLKTAADTLRPSDIQSLSERKLRDIVNSLILNFHIPIGSAYSGEHTGYYIIVTREEAEETYTVLRHHAISILKRAAAIRRLTFAELLGQLLLEEKPK